MRSGARGCQAACCVAQVMRAQHNCPCLTQYHDARIAGQPHRLPLPLQAWLPRRCATSSGPKGAGQQRIGQPHWGGHAQ